MSIAWQDHWELSIEIMDAEHRALIATLNRLIEDFAQAPLSSEDPQTSLRAQALMEALEAFGIQARAHFEHEKRFMRAIDYPHLGAHANEHALLHGGVHRDVAGLEATADHAARCGNPHRPAAVVSGSSVGYRSGICAVLLHSLPLRIPTPMIEPGSLHRK